MEITLRKNFFTDKERQVLEHEGMKASIFRYDSGVEAVRLANSEGSLVMLPYKGQQIWDAVMGGRRLTMKSPFPEPKNVGYFVDTYGCFLLHGGALRAGCMGPEDVPFPNHGELPYADYNEAAIVAGKDAKGNYIGLTGYFDYSRAWADIYRARPMVKMYQGSGLLDVSMAIENKSAYPMELMYLCHVNYLPVNFGRMVQSVDWAPDKIAIRISIPKHLRPPQSFVDLLEKVKKNPRVTEVLQPEDEYDPEIVLNIKGVKVDEKGWTHFMQVHPDGSADYVGYMPEEFDHNIRWLARRKNEEAYGFAIPATCGVEGYAEEKKRGSIKVIPAGAVRKFSFVTGYMNKKQTSDMAEKISRM